MSRVKKLSPSVQLAVDEFEFDSKLPSEAELRNAALDPFSEARQRHGDASLSKKLQRSAVTLAQATNAIAANRNILAQGSLGSQALAGVAELVSKATFQHDTVLADVLEDASSYIDLALTKSLGSVPFVSLAANAIVVAVELAKLFDDTSYRDRRPPLYQMSPRDDEDRTMRALELVGRGDDWTSLFLPATVPSTSLQGGGALPGAPGCDRWPGDGETLAKDGASWNRIPWDGDPERFGVAPGSLHYIDDGVQSRITAEDITLPSAKKPRYLDALAAGKNLQAATDLVFPRGQWAPSLAALGRAVWAMLGTDVGTTLWAVDARRVGDAWQEWHDSLVSWRCFVDATYGDGLTARLPNGLGKNEMRDHIALALGRLAASEHDRTAYTFATAAEEHRPEIVERLLTQWRPDRGQSVGKDAVLHARRLAERQRDACKTTLNALVASKAPAFADKSLRDLLLQERAALLDAGKLDDVELDDVPDQGLRTKLARRQQDAQRVDPQAAEKRRQKRELQAYVMRRQIRSPLGFDESETNSEGGGGAGLLAAGGGIAAGFLLWRLTRR